MSNYITIEANPRFLQKTTKKNTLWRFFFTDKMLPVSLTQEPFSYFSYRECSVHVRTYAYAYSRNLEKMYRFFLISWTEHFYHEIGINISHSVGILALGFPLSFYWLSGVKWIRMWSHRPWLRLLTKPIPILSWSVCHGSHNFVNLS